MNILVTNDDGIQARGIMALAEEMRGLGNVAVVAPDRERSAVGHSLTLHHPLRAAEMGLNMFAVDGTPTDCVNLGIHALLDFKPDIVVSGINRGANLGDDVTYSGTVSAAMEATLMGIPAFAVSLATDRIDGHYSFAAKFAARLARLIFENGLPADTFLNVNVPDLPESATLRPLLTRQGKRKYEGLIVDKTDPRGRKYYWIGNGEQNFLDIEGTDYHAVSRGHISITPLHLDLTNYKSFETLEKWRLDWSTTDCPL
ncbi:MAG TPA: 5'/3'-nucleotidase SurE [Geobacteraceae bacterium]|nr:5'/3'-nucleotidase SurE [Geobacteraceae bacterium]